MQKINLRELYPDIYKTDTFLEVTDEVQAVFLADQRAEAARQRQIYRYKAYYSLDRGDGIEHDALIHPMTPEGIVETKLTQQQLYAALDMLPDKSNAATLKKPDISRVFRSANRRSTASRLPVVLRSSASADFSSKQLKNPETMRFSGFFLFRLFALFWHSLTCFNPIFMG